MAKKPKDAPEQKPPVPGPAPSAEEMRRRHVETNAKDRLQQLGNDLAELLKGNLKKAESLRALEQVGVKVVEIALQTRGRLRAADGRGDAFLEATAANVRTALRHADKVMEGHDREMSAWSEALEIAGPALEDLKRISKGLERPGVKVAIVPGGGDGLFDEEGQPTEKAVAPAPEPPPAPAPVPPTTWEPEPVVPAPAPVTAREIPTLGTKGCPVIDILPEPEPRAVVAALDEFDLWDEEERLNEFERLMGRLEEDGVEEGLKRKDWLKAVTAWQALIDEDPKEAHARLTFAIYYRKACTWDIPTQTEIESVWGTDAPQRAAGE